MRGANSIIAAANRRRLGSTGSLSILLFLCLVSYSTVSSAAVVSSIAGGQNVDLGLDGSVDGTFDARNVAYDPSLGGGDARVSYEFDVSSLAGMGTFSSAILRTTRTGTFTQCFGLSPCPVPTSLNVAGYIGNGTFEAADFSAGSPLGAAVVGGVGSFIDLDVTPFIASLLSGPLAFAGFTYSSPTPGGVPLSFTSDVIVSFGSVSQVPLPAALPLFLSAFAALGWLGWRRWSTSHRA
jgi:hypothetical protein